MVNKQKIAFLLERVVIFLSSFVLAYGALKLSGLFAPSPEGGIRTFYEQAPRIALYLALPAALGRLLLAGWLREGYASMLLWSGVLIMAAGLVMSSMVRFEGRILLTEGQQFSGAAEEYAEGSLAVGSKASSPRFALAVKEVAPSISRNGRTADRISVKVAYRKEGEPTREISMTSALPTVVDGVFFRIRQFGYSPRYRVTGNGGMVLDESYVALAVFPPGNEDSFRLQPVPHTFYVQYYPDGREQDQEKAQNDAGPTGPEFRLRIVRNLELLYHGPVRLHEQVLFESMALSIEDVRKWVEISVIQDHGLVLFYAGGAMFASALLIAYRANRSIAGSRSPQRGTI